jgi:hypothetical protein
MRLPTSLPLFASLLLGGAPVLLPAHAATAADVPAKQRLCKPCTMPDLPIALPRHGMVLHYRSFFHKDAPWYTVDLERGEASRIAHKIEIVEHTTRPIPPDDLAALKQIAGRIWASADELPTISATDVAWELWQLDGDAVRNDFARGLPDGLAKEAARIMERLVDVPAPVAPTTLP